jgi:hypothetical protein
MMRVSQLFQSFKSADLLEKSALRDVYKEGRAITDPALSILHIWNK